MKRFLNRNLLTTVLEVIGAVSLVFGVWLIFVPAAFITAGILLILVGGLLA